MLVLSRKAGEEIILDMRREALERLLAQHPDGVQTVIQAVDIRGDKVRLGIDAPKELPVHRREVWEAIKRAEQQDGNEAA